MHRSSVAIVMIPREQGKAFEFLSDLSLNQAADPLAKITKKSPAARILAPQGLLDLRLPTWS